MNIAEGLDILQLPIGPGGNALIHPVLLSDQKDAVLFDTGLPGQLPMIRDEMGKAGVPFEKLKMVIITHQDIDHIGNLSGIQRELDDVKVVSHKDDKPYIEFEKMPIKLFPERLAQIEASMSGNGGKPVIELLRSRVNQTVEDGEVIDVCGGIEIIHTPGHTPGNLCLYLEKYRVLISGDTLNAANGQLFGPNPQFTPDMGMAVNSLKKLKMYDIETVICYHGGVVQGNVQQRLDELIG